MKSTDQIPVMKNSCELSCHMDTKLLLANKSHDLANIGGLGQTGLSISVFVNYVLPGRQSTWIRNATLVKKTTNLAAPSRWDEFLMSKSIDLSLCVVKARSRSDLASIS